MNIGSNNKGVSGRLSNFTPRPFVFDGVECASMEGLLQSFKFDKHHIQKEVCKLTGFAAKRRGSKRNKAWKSRQSLWWSGERYDRDSKAYQALLDRAFNALSKNKKFAKDLIATGDSVLVHTIGKNKITDTVLTEKEFCSRLMKIRKALKLERSDNSNDLCLECAGRLRIKICCRKL
jgi:predicted NAD-dependent protein-ADP-ribosyltransferase YbiA (DUF1768 family)